MEKRRKRGRGGEERERERERRRDGDARKDGGKLMKWDREDRFFAFFCGRK